MRSCEGHRSVVRMVNGVESVAERPMPLAAGSRLSTVSSWALGASIVATIGSLPDSNRAVVIDPISGTRREFPFPKGTTSASGLSGDVFATFGGGEVTFFDMTSLTPVAARSLVPVGGEGFQLAGIPTAR